MKNCTSDEDDSIRSARSEFFRMFSYSSIWRSTTFERWIRLVTFLSIWVRL